MISSPEKHIKTYILGAIIVSLLSIFILGIYALNKTHEENVQDRIKQTIKSVKQLYAHGVKQDAKQISSLLETIVSDPSLLQNLQNKDHSTLLLKYQPLFKTLKEHYGITHFYFSDSHRKNILRVHNPKRYGDTINRDTTLKAQKNKRIYHGVELGLFGLMTLRVVLPVYRSGQLLGFVELGKEIEQVIKNIRSAISVDLMVTIYKQHLNQKDWEEGMALMNRQAKWNRFSNLIVVDSTFETVQATAQVLSLLDSEQHEHFRNNSNIDTKIIKQDELLFNLPLFESSGREIGDLISLGFNSPWLATYD